MKRVILRSISSFSRNFSSSPTISNRIPIRRNLLPPISRSYSPRFFSSENDSSDQNPKSTLPDAVEDVSNEELKKRIEQYFKGDEEALASVYEAILKRKLSGKHEHTDDELLEEFRFSPIDGIRDEDFEEDFEEVHETDEDIPNLCHAENHVVNSLLEDEFFSMDEKKWGSIVQEASKFGLARDMKECEEILEDMRDWDKLLPDDIKRKVKAKFDELGDKCERQELEPEEAYQHFKEFEDQIVADYLKKTEQEPKSDEVTEPVEKMSDDPPGEGPILRWQSRVVMCLGGDAWHPKNRKVKLSVTVKELGLTKYQFRRLREIVGKRYHPGRDELTITSERFEHREENRKDCLKTLLKIIEEAGKATALVDEARTSYVKQRLKANPAFMARLLAKTKQTPVAAIST